MEILGYILLFIFLAPMFNYLESNNSEVKKTLTGDDIIRAFERILIKNDKIAKIFENISADEKITEEETEIIKKEIKKSLFLEDTLPINEIENLDSYSKILIEEKIKEIIEKVNTPDPYEGLSTKEKIMKRDR